MENVIKNINIIESTYKNDNWIEYEIGNFKGYELDEIDLGMEGEIEKKYNSVEIRKKLLNKISIDKCSEFLRYLIIECTKSENDMFFVEYNELKDIDVVGGLFDSINEVDDLLDCNIIKELDEEIDKFGLDGYIEYGSDNITVHGGIITEFLFDLQSLQRY